MAAKLDPTQERIFRAVDDLPIDRRPSTSDLCAWLDVSPQQLSDLRACRRILAPRQLRKLARQLGDAQPIVGEITRAAGQDIVDAPSSETTSTTRLPAAAELGAQVAALTLAVLRAEADGYVDARERAALAADLDVIAQRVAGLRAGLREVA